MQRVGLISLPASGKKNFLLLYHRQGGLSSAAAFVSIIAGEDEWAMSGLLLFMGFC